MDGMNFTRWKEKMKFLLTGFKVYYVLEGPPIGVLSEEEQRKHDQDETLCRGYILRKNNKRNDKKRKSTWNSFKDNKKDKKPLSEVVCYKCGEKGYIKRYCKNPKKKNQNSNKNDESANAVEQVDTTKITVMVSEMNIGMIQELHMASVITTDDWWYDSDATTHVCNNRDLFKTYKETEDGHEVMMGDNHTSKAFETFKIYKAEVENQKGKKIQILRSDRGGEYFSTKFSSYCELQGLIHQRTTPYTPQQNGVAERKNKVLQDMINAMLKEYVGYAKDSKSYRCLDLDSNVIVQSRDVDFFENKFRYDSTSTNKIVTQIPQDISGLNLNSNNKRNMAESSSALRRSERAKKERNSNPNFIDSQAIIFLVEGNNENNVINKIPVLLNVKDAPKTYKEAITSRNSTFWKEAIDDEIDFLVSNNTWELLDLPSDMNKVDTISGKKVKRRSGGYALNEFHYIDKIIDKFQHLNIEEANTSYESSCKPVENDGRVVAQIEYASAIGCLMYVAHCTRPDIAYAVCKLSRYTSNPSQDHWKAIGRLFGYLKRTRQLALYYGRFPTVLEGYLDASWITGSSDSKSTTG
nr:valine--tRNA ligase, mitochondrial 1-like [Tanacetum cinerariifolium]